MANKWVLKHFGAVYKAMTPKMYNSGTFFSSHIQLPTQHNQLDFNNNPNIICPKSNSCFTYKTYSSRIHPSLLHQIAKPTYTTLAINLGSFSKTCLLYVYFSPSSLLLSWSKQQSSRFIQTFPFYWSAASIFIAPQAFLNTAVKMIPLDINWTMTRLCSVPDRPLISLELASSF